MFQTASTGITNLYRKLPYLGGLCKFWFIPIDEVDSIPGIDPYNQFLLDEPVLKEDKLWRGPVPVPDAQLGFTETQKNDAAGVYYEVKIQAQPPGDIPQQRINLDNMAYGQYLVVGKQRAGGMYLLFGSMDSPLDFDNQYTNGPGAAQNASTKIAFTGESIPRALVLPQFLGDASGYIYPNGDPGGPIVSQNETEIIYIIEESTKTINWTTNRRSRFGAFPEVEVYLKGEDNLLYKAAVQPYIDFPPPDFTKMFFEFSGNQNGFISIK